MLKMGQMCHCTKYWTVVSWDADGTLRYRLDQLAGEAGAGRSVGLAIDGTDMYVVGTAVPGEDDGRLQKWAGIDGTPTRSWFSDRNGQTAYAVASVGANQRQFQRVAIGNDGTVWATQVSPAGAALWDSSGIQQGYLSSYGTALQGISGSDEMHICHANGQDAASTAVVRRYDPALSLIDSADLQTVPAVREVYPIPTAGGFVATGLGGGGGLGRFWDSALADLGANGGWGVGIATTVVSCLTDSGGHVYVFASGTGGTTLTKYVVSSWASVWSVTPTIGPGAMICDANDNVYIGSSAAIKQYDAASGAVNWTLTSGTVEAFRRYGDDLLAVESSTATGVRRFDTAGNSAWKSSYSTVSSGAFSTTFDCRTDGDGNVYMCGPRIKLESGAQSLAS